MVFGYFCDYSRVTDLTHTKSLYCFSYMDKNSSLCSDYSQTILLLSDLSGKERMGGRNEALRVQRS